MFKKLFGKKEEVSKVVELSSPLTGKVIALEEVPDPVFSQKMMGDGLAIEPTEGKVVSPVDGEIMQLFPTKHAVGIKAENGAEILIHIGLETVNMKGEGFEAHIAQGDQVKKGDTLVTFDLALVGEKASSTVTPIIITNGDDMESVNKSGSGAVTAAQDVVLTVTAK
ncbi:PTS system glucose-specific IIA component [Bacillus ectoiniformans]|uniref:PTS sugar transporter subunit IIA n=1 Tax=Bacillus ectoiniformans TaxID=1494429 RepID=UPI00195C974A|nr:PTS glucose transporter subunit IIA [Bacillus ectoiniformans]MBM7647898.1 PTS system glucose-specific IIA component [Bacillus ectoiniformans]